MTDLNISEDDIGKSKSRIDAILLRKCRADH